MTESLKMLTILVPRISMKREYNLTKKVITIKVLDMINLKVVRDENVVTQHFSRSRHWRNHTKDRGRHDNNLEYE